MLKYLQVRFSSAIFATHMLKPRLFYSQQLPPRFTLYRFGSKSHLPPNIPTTTNGFSSCFPFSENVERQATERGLEALSCTWPMLVYASQTRLQVMRINLESDLGELTRFGRCGFLVGRLYWLIMVN